MSTFWYLVRTTIKNRLLLLIKRPAWLIISVAFLVSLLFSMGAGFAGRNSGWSGEVDIGVPQNTWSAAVFVVYALIMYTYLKKALTQGATAFGLEDVQLLFTAPIRPQSVLLYGVVRQMGGALMMLLIMLFQIFNILQFMGGAGVGAVVALYISLFLVVFLAQVIGLSLYAMLSEKPKWLTRARYIVDAAMGLIVVAGLVGGVRAGGLDGVISCYASPLWNYVPIIGWLRGAVVSAAHGAAGISAFLMLASVLLAALVFMIMWRRNPDYYESVMGVTQVNYDKQQLVKEGKQSMTLGGNVKVKKTGLGHGAGASAFFFRQLAESRRGGLLFVDMTSIIMLLVGGGMGVVFTKTGQGMGMDAKFFFYILIAFIAYLQMIFAMKGSSFLLEMQKPYIFLVPDSAQKKVIFSTMEPAIKSTLDAVLALLPYALLTRDAQLLLHVVPGALLIGTCFLVFVAATLACEGLLGSIGSKTVFRIICMLLQMVLIAPCAVLVVVVGTLMFPAAPALGMAFGIAYNVIIFVALTLLLAGTLHRPSK